MASKRYTLKDGTKLTETQVETLVSLDKRGEQNVRWYHAMAVKVLRNESMIAGYKQIRITERGLAALRELGLIADAAPHATESVDSGLQPSVAMLRDFPKETLDENQRQLLHIVNQDPALQELFAEMGMSTKLITHVNQPAPAGEAIARQVEADTFVFDGGDVTELQAHIAQLEADNKRLQDYIGHDASMFGYAPPIGETWKSACADAHNDALALTAQLQAANERIRELEVDKRALMKALEDIAGMPQIFDAPQIEWSRGLARQTLDTIKKGQS